MNKPPEGWTFLDWQDPSGSKWKDCLPNDVVDHMRLNAKVHITKEVRG